MSAPPEPAFANLSLHVEAGVARLQLNRPQTLNAMAPGLLDDLHQALRGLQRDDAVRALVLSGAGKAFCSGADLSVDLGGTTRAERAEAGARQLQDIINPLAGLIQGLPFPVISAVHGAAAGAGASLALAADIVLAARSAYFLFPFMPRLGILPDLGATWHLQRRLGPARAMAVSITGERIDGATAAEWGLIWRCVEDSQLEEQSLALAARLAAGPRQAAPELRAALRAADANDLDAQLDYEYQRQRDLLGRASFAEGVQAFLQKRAPRFE